MGRPAGDTNGLLDVFPLKQLRYLKPNLFASVGSSAIGKLCAAGKIFMRPCDKSSGTPISGRHKLFKP